jgi:SAM-dependent methyltransferase
MELTGERTTDAIDRPCPVCGRPNGKLFRRGNIDPRRISEFSYASRKEPECMSHTLRVCEGCDLVYADADVSSETLSLAYADAAYDSGFEAHCAARTYHRLLAPWGGRLGAGRCAVDIGAGNGALLPLLAESGFEEVIGIEPSSSAIAAAPADAREHLRHGVFSAEALADVQPSLVCAFMLLEHVPDPVSLLRDVHRVLCPGGLAAVVVHNRRAPVNRLLGGRSPIIDIEHVQLFSPRSLRAALSAAGLEVLAIRSFRNRYPLRYWIRLLPLPAGLKRRITASADRRGWGRAQLSLPVGNLFAVAQKA